MEPTSHKLTILTILKPFIPHRAEPTVLCKRKLAPSYEKVKHQASDGWDNND